MGKEVNLRDHLDRMEDLGWANWAKDQKPSTNKFPEDRLRGGKRARHLQYKRLD